MSGILQTLFLGAAAAVKDAYFNLVTLLLNTTATNGAQNNTFLDSSTNNFSITRNGNTTQGTFTPFSQTGWSNNFVRSGSQFLAISNATGDFNFGTGALTIECFVNLSSMPSGSGYPTSYWLFGGGPVNNDPGIDLYITSTQIGFNLVDFVSPTVIGNHGMSVGNWYHVAVVRGGGSNQTVSIYVNGTRIATASSVTASAATTSNIAISAAEPVGSTGGNLDGYISNYRVVKGSAVYDPTVSTLTVPVAPLTAITNTVLLTCQSNRFVDNSANNYSITINGTPSVQAFSPFAPSYTTPTTYSNWFDGSGDYLSFTGNSNTSIGSNNWTVEAWVYITSASQQYQQVLRGQTSNEILLMIETTNTRVQCEGTGGTATSPATFQLNTWNHCAAVRNGSTVTVYLNGIGGTPVTMNPATTTSEVFRIGTDTSPSRYLNGCVSNLRMVVGTAVYTANFTPPTAPLTAISGTGLLTCQSSTFVDNSTNNFTITSTGNVQPVASPTPFAPTVETEDAAYDAALVGGSGYYDGSGDYLAWSGSSIGSNQFCFECWFYNTGNFTSTTPTLLGIANTIATAALGVRINSSTTISIDAYGVAAYNFTVPTMYVNTWYHVAVVRGASNVCAIFLNGVRSATQTLTNTFASSSSIGFTNASEPRNFTGYISNVRLTVGSTPYDPTQTGFAPPLTPPTAITNTQLLLLGTNAGIYDAAAKNDLETSGSAQVTTAQAKWGTTSINIPTSSGLFSVSKPIYAMGGDYTIEFWVYHTSTISSEQHYVTFDATGSYFFCGVNTTGVFMGRRGTAIDLQSSTTLSANTWYHIAFTRSGTTTRIYVDGTSVANTSLSTVYGAANLFVGNDPSYYFVGNMDDVRITNGFARYTGASFTVPSSAFPIQ